MYIVQPNTWTRSQRWNLCSWSIVLLQIKLLLFSPINSMRGTKNFATKEPKNIWLMSERSWALKRKSWHQQLLLHMNGYVKSFWRSQRWEWSCSCQLRPIIIKGGFAATRIVRNLLVHCSQCKLGFSFFLQSYTTCTESWADSVRPNTFVLFDVER